MRTLLIAPVAVAMLAGCNTVAGMKEDSRQATEYTYEKREEYQRKIASELRDLDARTDELKAEAARSGEAVKAEFARDLDELGRQKAVLDEKMNAVKSSSAAAWDSAKSEMNSAMDSMRRIYERARARFQ
jgi:predicted small secreted protein